MDVLLNLFSTTTVDIKQSFLVLRMTTVVSTLHVNVLSHAI